MPGRAVHRKAGDDQDADLRMQGQQFAEDFFAGHIRHRQIYDDHVDIFPIDFEETQTVPDVESQVHVVSMPLEHLEEDLAEAVHVGDDQYLLIAAQQIGIEDRLFTSDDFRRSGQGVHSGFSVVGGQIEGEGGAGVPFAFALDPTVVFADDGIAK